MDEFIRNLELINDNDKLCSANEYFHELILDPNFINLGLYMLKNLKIEYQFFVVRLIKEWFILHINEMDDADVVFKQKIIFDLILENLQVCSFLFDILLIISNKLKEKNNFIGIFELFFNINDDELVQFRKYKIIFLYKLLKTNVDYINFHDLYALFYEHFIHNVNNNMRTNDDFHIFIYMLKVSNIFSYRINIPREHLIILVQVIFKIIDSNNVPDAHLIGYCCRFFLALTRNDFYKNTLSDFISQYISLISSKVFSFLNDDYILLQILHAYHVFYMPDDIFKICIAIVELTQQNKLDFYENPYLFYKEIYSSFSSRAIAPRSYVYCIFEEAVKREPEILKICLNFPCNDPSKRIVANLSKYFHDFNLEMEFHDWTLYAIKNCPSDDIEIASLLYLIYKSIHIFNDEEIHNIYNLIYKISVFKSIINQIFICKIFRICSIFPESCASILIDFLPYDPTNNALKCIETVFHRNTNSFSIYNDFIYNYVVNEIGFKIKQYFEEDNDELLESVTYCANILTILVKSNNNRIENLIPILQKLILVREEEENFWVGTSNLISTICSLNNQYSIQAFLILIEGIQNNDLFITYFEHTHVSILSFISFSPEAFKSMKISDFLISYCFDIMQNNHLFILYSTDIISYVIQVDKSLNYQQILSYCDNFIPYMNKYPLLKLGLTEIFASIVITHIVNIDINIFVSIIDCNYLVRVYDKYLICYALVILSDFYQEQKYYILERAIDLFLENHKKNKLKEKLNELSLPISIVESSKDYQFLSPIQQIQFSQILYQKIAQFPDLLLKYNEINII